MKFFKKILIIFSATIFYLVSPLQILAAENILLFDDFNDGNYNGWTIKSGNWVVENGYLKGSASGQGLGGQIVTGSSQWNDFRLDLNVRGDRGVDQYVVFRYTANGYYGINLRYGTGSYDTPQIKFWKIDHNNSIPLGNTHSFPLINQKWYHVKIETFNENINIWIDNTLIFRFTDTNTNINSGGISLSYSIGSVGIADMWFDNVKVTALPEPFLDLPWDYSGKGLTFNEAAMAINSYFDHQYPLLSRGLDLSEPATASASIMDYLGRTSNKEDYTKHDGYDWGNTAKAKLGDPVLAAASGSATYINSCSSCGNMVVIDHGNGYQTRYMHLLEDGLITKIPNQPVPVNDRQQIGKVGFTGNVKPNDESGAHIHFGVFQDKNGDGNFNDNEPDGVIDPFGWQSDLTDPWPNYTFNYLGQNRTGNKSYYLWKNYLANMASTVTPTGSTLNIGNYTLNFPPNSTNKNIVISAKSAPVVQPSSILTSLGSTLLVKANDTAGNPVTSLQNPFNILLDFSSLDGSRIKNNTLSFYSSSDGISWTKENTSFPTQTSAQTQIDHFSYFALIGERKDTTPPTTIAVLTGANGQPSWFRSDVQLTLNAEDDNLGVYYTVYKVNEGEMKIYESPLNFTSEGHQKVDFYSVDNDDNTEETKSIEFDIDKNPPQITINSPTDKAVYTLNQPVTADWSVSDSLSGIDNAATNATTISGNPFDTSTPGTHTFTVSAKDLAGNESNKTVSYLVHYNYDGFLPPLYDKDFKKGRTIPVKFQLTDNNGAYIGTAEAHLFVDNNPAKSSGNSNLGNLFRYDSTANQYIYNLSTSTLATGPHTLKVVLDDGTEYITTIEIK